MGVSCQFLSKKANSCSAIVRDCSLGLNEQQREVAGSGGVFLGENSENGQSATQTAGVSGWAEAELVFAMSILSEGRIG